MSQLAASQKEERSARLALSLKEDECQQLKKELEQPQPHQTAFKSTDTITQDLKTKALEDENSDLKKRVESYKKTVEQLNSSNNSGRDKLLMAK